MKESICGAKCAECSMNSVCNGCGETGGCPFGSQCFIASYIKVGGREQFEAFKKTLMAEINGLQIAGMPQVTELYALAGSFVNLEYPLPNGERVKFLEDSRIYLGNQMESEFGGDRCFGIVAGLDFILVCTYGKDGETPELVRYQKR